MADTGPSPGGSSRGAKNQKEREKARRGSHFKNTVLYVCSNRGAKREMEAPISNGWAGTTGHPAGDGPGLIELD